MRVTDYVDARVRLGGFLWRSEYTTQRAGTRIDAKRNSGIDLLWGVSLDYELSSAWSVGLDLQRIEFDDEPTHLLAIQARWRIRHLRFGALLERHGCGLPQPVVQLRRGV